MKYMAAVDFIGFLKIIVEWITSAVCSVKKQQNKLVAKRWECNFAEKHLVGWMVLPFYGLEIFYTWFTCDTSVALMKHEFDLKDFGFAAWPLWLGWLPCKCWRHSLSSVFYFLHFYSICPKSILLILMIDMEYEAARLGASPHFPFISCHGKPCLYTSCKINLWTCI